MRQSAQRPEDHLDQLTSRRLWRVAMAVTIALSAAPNSFGRATGAETAMSPTKRLAENASIAPNLSSFNAAIQATGLVGTLSAPGPYTLFAPSNAAFARLPASVQESLMAPAGLPMLTRIIGYHIVPGGITSDNLRGRIAAGGGKAVLHTIIGETLIVSFSDQAISLTDANGNKSYIEDADLRQANGMMHIVNGVMLPRLD
ncbi:MAG: hypothetical protein B7Y49_12620 [Sphingomonas sp. 28-62-11]|nr:MAG: hypothetical protein B7Y49_12620 [Sphingomonas sp. 28-62-11]